ncbi:SDR family oxidoreductase [Actinokineospora sp. HUAS TT18]|uniref:SDR family oxidoreductase n=1 Tax=Actinokineospora sp. HUAS TT18 TaxID=3447451 RepID=UPI003F51F9DE
MAAHARPLMGKVAVVTGGARGIGAAIAAELVRAGVKVVIGDLDGDLAKQTAESLGATGLRLDVSDRPGFTAFLDHVDAEVGPVDVLVNNAGIMPIGLIEDESDQVTQAQLAVNLHAVIHGTREAVRRMRPRATGHVVNVASVAGKLPVAAGATYCATKFAVVGFTEAVRQETRGSGVEVSCVLPGIVRTELAAGLNDSKGIKVVTPQDVAAAVVDVLRHPKPEVFVPKSAGRALRSAAFFPRGLAEWIGRKTGAERLFLDAAGSADRRAYEQRAAHSAPGEQA